MKNIEILAPAALPRQSSSELLAPAGNLEKLKIALKYGADAVYFGLPGFSLRARASQFGPKEVKEGVELCRKMGKKIYVAFNIYAHNIHINNIKKQINLLKEIQPDAIILSDPGILELVKKELPKVDIHISTQVNVTNKEAAKFWYKQGAKRIILAREVSIKEIKEIKQAVPELELEYFVHGAMCMAYSGRCILSKWMLNRSANLGDCAQPCRWEYKENKKIKEDKEISIIDDKNRFEIDVEEDSTGTYLFNSNDICLIEHLKELREAGIDSFKIEGRNKSVYYVAMVVRAYRKVLDGMENMDESDFRNLVKDQKEELEELSNRGYWTGFAFQNEPPHLFNEASKEAKKMFVGIGLFDEVMEKSDRKKVFVHNFFQEGDEVEIVSPEEIIKARVLEIKDEDGKTLESAHGGQEKKYYVKFDKKFKDFFILRKKV